jgi:mannosyltransferase OCH1-like enzyme
MSKYSETYRLSGWDYRFYTDEDVASFMSTHFPPEVLEAFDALVRGAFKADLFLVLRPFIHGGVYADVDMRLVSTLMFQCLRILDLWWHSIM